MVEESFGGSVIPFVFEFRFAFFPLRLLFFPLPLPSQTRSETNPIGRRATNLFFQTPRPPHRRIQPLPPHHRSSSTWPARDPRAATSLHTQAERRARRRPCRCCRCSARRRPPRPFTSRTRHSDRCIRSMRALTMRSLRVQAMRQQVQPGERCWAEGWHRVLALPLRPF